MNAAAAVHEMPFDSDAWHREREDCIRASRAAGRQHLDRIERSVEVLRGQEIYYVHDPKVRGVVRTVGNHGDVFVHWSDGYSAEKEMATRAMDGGKVVWRSALAPSDMKDYVLASSAARQSR